MVLDRDKLKNKIESKFLTNETLAKAAGISQTTVNRARNGGDITVKVLKKICDVLECDPKDIQKK